MARKKYQKKKKVYRRRRVHKKKKMNKIQTLKLRMPGTICPDRYLVKLRYIDETSSTLAAPGAAYGYIRYFLNGLYDPNPLILTAPVQGFKELASMYSNYRVNGSKLNLVISNMESFPVMIVLIPTNYDLTTYLTSADKVRTLIGNPYCKYRVLSAKGGIDKSSMSTYISSSKILGSNKVKFEDSYTGTNSSNPTSLQYWNIACYALGGQNFTASGVLFETRITYYAQWFNRVPLDG